MKKAVLALGGLSVAGTLLVFPVASFAHKGEPHNAAKAIAQALKHPLVLHGGTAARVTIVHVVRGCHVWSNGKSKARGAKIFLRHGGRVTVRNQDVDMHRFMRLAGPRMMLGGYMGMNHQSTLTFRKPGVYRLRTTTEEMAGMPDVKTIGPDNPLPMVVVVS
jgi:plastocyanin